MLNHTATYSPEDNKLRLYPAHKLDPAEYERVKAAGFKWAPKQGLFVAPMWTPAREDLLLSLCDEIDDEDTSLAERAEARADRFDEYSSNNAERAEQAHKAVSAICDNIPLGQPILIGHHSERHARKDAERIENGMRRAVKIWDTAEYWKSRAAGAVRAAKYKELPAVRARRIKGLEADKRKQERNLAEAQKWLKLWLACEAEQDPAVKQAAGLRIADACWLHLPRKEGDREDFNGSPTAYDALNGSYPNLYAPRTLDEVIEVAKSTYPRYIAHCFRWLDHYVNRIAYERAMLGESGGIETDKVKPEIGGAVRCLWAPRGGWAYIQKVNKVTVTILHQWNDGGRVFKHNEPLDKIHEVMSRAQVEDLRAAGKIQEASEGRGFWILEAPEPKPESPKDDPNPESKPEAADFAAMRESLRAGVQVVTAPQLFPTPRELAKRVAMLADVQPGNRVLEPSAGTGALLGALGGKMFGHNPDCGTVHAVEINRQLAGMLQSEFPLTEVHCADFLEFVQDDFVKFDRIVMNPPFANAEDIKHIKHALTMLAPGGRLVAICSNGPRQRAELMHLGEWEDLPPGSFAASGTNVNAALLVVQA